MDTEVTPRLDEPISNLSAFMRNIAELMDKLESVQKKIGPLDIAAKETGLKGVLMRVFEACFPLSRNSTDEQLWEEHQHIRELLSNELIPKGSNICSRLESVKRDAAIQRLMDWCTAQGADLSKVTFAKSTTGPGYGLFSKQDLEAQKEFLKLPKSVVIFAENFRLHEALGYLVVKDPVLSSMQNVLMTYGLLAEFYKYEQSFYWPYLESLPSKYDNAVYFELEDMEQLKGTTSFREALILWKSCVRQYAYFHLKLIENFDSQSASNSTSLGTYDLLSNFCYQDYRWSLATVMSRSCTVSSSPGVGYDLVLTPFLDLCSHSDTVYTLELDVSDNCYKPVVSFEVPANGEVSIFYGARTTSHFVLTHGFYLDNNAHDFLLYRLLFDDGICCKEEKHDILLRIGLSDLSGFPIGYQKEAWAGDLLAYMRVYASTGEEISTLQLISDTDLHKTLYGTKPISRTSEEEAVSCILRSLKKSLASIPGSNDQDASLIQSGELSFVRVNILRLRMSERSILNHVFSTISSAFKVPE